VKQTEVVKFSDNLPFHFSVIFVDRVTINI